MSNTANAIATGYGPRLGEAEQVEIHVLGPTDPTFSIGDLEYSIGDERAATPELALALRSRSSYQPVLQQEDWKEGKAVRTTIIALL